MEEGKPTRRRVIKKKVIIPIVAIIVLLIGKFVFLLSPPPKPAPIGRQIPPWKGDIFLKKFIEDKENAFFDYLIAARLHEPMTDELEKEFYSSDCNNKVIQITDNLREYVKREKPVIDIIKKGVAKRNCFVPKVEGFTPLIPQFRLLREIAKVMVAQARVKETDGNYKGAYEDYLDTIRFGNDFARGGVLIHGLINIAIDSMALGTMQSGLKNSDSQTLKMIVVGLKEVENSLVPLSEILKNEPIYATDEYIECILDRRGNLCSIGLNGEGLIYNIRYNVRWLKIYFNKNKIRRNVKDFMEKIIEGADKPPYRGEREDFKRCVPKDPISSLILPNITSLKFEYAECYARLRGIKLRASVELYQREYNELPENLETLVNTGIIEQVPKDPFSNEPFKYIDGKVYSIGRDFKDDNCSQEDDIIF